MVTVEFIDGMPSGLDEGKLYIVEAFHAFQRKNTMQAQKLENYNNYIDFYLLLESFLKSHNVTFNQIEVEALPSPKIINQIEVLFSLLKTEINNQKAKTRIDDTRHRFDMFFKNVFVFEFTDGDIDVIQKRLNELRDIIAKSDLFSDEHKRRLLMRFERLQRELHKKVSDLDRFWGLIGDAGVALGKFGESAKPIVDRIKEIADIVWRTQAKAEELPSGTTIPILSDKSEKEDIAN